MVLNLEIPTGISSLRDVLTVDINFLPIYCPYGTGSFLCGLVLMIAVVCMGVIMNAAAAVIQQVGRNDQHNGKRKDPKLVLMPYLLGQQ